MSLDGLQVHCDMRTLYGVWADAIVDELVRQNARRNESATAMLLLALAFGAPPGMTVQLPKKPLD